VAGDGKNLLWIKHPALPAQHILDLTVDRGVLSRWSRSTAFYR
jgi:hypothetical protein